MTKDARRLFAFGLVTLLLGYTLQRLAALDPAWVERVYSRGGFPLIARALSAVASLFPFSLAEVLVGLLIVPTVLWLFTVIRSLRARPPGHRLSSVRLKLGALLAVLGSVYLLFVLLWGLNYARQPLASSIGLETRPSSVTELVALCTDLIDRANAVRQRVSEDSSGVMRLSDGTQGALPRASLGYEEAATRYPVLAGRYSQPKAVVVSELWSYTGIAGIYFPFTGEANVNIAQPDSGIPAVALHEMAHQRGFAREDEANYLAYLAATHHPDADFQYSGVLSATVSAMAALRQRDPGRYAQLKDRYSEGVQRDLARVNEFWRRHQGPVERISNRVNDQYLKANMQPEGVGSYGRMVDLLLAEYRARRDG